MKNVTLFIIAIAMVSIFTGCSKQPQPHPGPIYYEYVESTKVVAMWARLHQDIANPKAQTFLQNVAVAIKKAALTYKEHGIKYFYITQAQVPLSITNMTDLVAYCQPRNNGFHVADYRDKSTSLEEKGWGLYDSYGGAYMSFVGIEGDEPKIILPTWSVEEVLNDKVIESYIAAALEDGKYVDKTIEYKTDRGIALYLTNLLKK